MSQSDLDGNHPSVLIIDIDIFVNCNWVNTRWQWYSTHLYANNTQNNINNNWTTQITTVQHNNNRTAQITTEHNNNRTAQITTEQHNNNRTAQITTEQHNNNRTSQITTEQHNNN